MAFIGNRPADTFHTTVKQSFTPDSSTTAFTLNQSVAGENEVQTLPGVPTNPEWAYVVTWGIMAPPGTPADIVEELNAALNSAASKPEVRDALINGGYVTHNQTVEEVNAFMAREIAKLAN